MRLNTATRIAFVAFAYFVAAWLCIEISESGSDLAPVWVPSGLALVAVLRWGPVMAVGVFVGEFLATYGVFGVGAASGIATGNALEPIVAAAVLHRMGAVPTLTKVRDVFGIVLAAGVGACVSTVIGVGTLAAAGVIAPMDVPRQLMLFWWSVVLGIILVAPFILAWRTREPVRQTLGRASEAAILIVAILLVGATSFAVQPFGGAMLLLIAPLLLWACLRFRAHGATGLIVLLSIMSAAAVYRGGVTLGMLSPTDTAQALQAMYALLTVSALFLVALIAERDAAFARATSASERLVLAQQVAGCGSWELELRPGHPRVLTWTTELCRLLDIAPGAQPTLDALFQRVHVDDRARVRVAIEATIGTGMPFSIEHRVVDRTGTQRDIVHTARVMSVGEDRHVLIIAVALDVTNQKSLDRLRDALVTTASHELRTPLTSIIGMASTLVERWDTLREEQRREFANIIEHQGMHLSGIIDDTLMQSRLDSRGVEVRPDPVHLRRAIDDAVKTLGEAGAHVQVSCPGDVVVAGSAEHVRRIVTNLLTNASKYGEAPITIVVDARPGEPMVDIHVVDHGPGIPQEFQSVMYQRFARGLGTINQPGTGLGLSIVRGLVEAAGGSVTYRRRDDEQATDFIVRLPSWTPTVVDAQSRNGGTSAAHS